MFVTYIDDIVRHTELNQESTIARGLQGRVNILNEAEERCGEYGWCSYCRLPADMITKDGYPICSEACEKDFDEFSSTADA